MLDERMSATTILEHLSLLNSTLTHLHMLAIQPEHLAVDVYALELQQLMLLKHQLLAWFFQHTLTLEPTCDEAKNVVSYHLVMHYTPLSHIQQIVRPHAGRVVQWGVNLLVFFDFPSQLPVQFEPETLAAIAYPLIVKVLREHGYDAERREGYTTHPHIIHLPYIFVRLEEQVQSQVKELPDGEENTVTTGELVDRTA